MATINACSNSDLRYILEFIGCDLVITQNSETIFKAKELSLCPWFDEVCDYCYCKHTIPAGGSIEIAGPLNANFLYVKVDWPTAALESNRLAAITLPNFTVQNLMPNGANFVDNGLGEYLTHTYPISDLLMLNSAFVYDEYKLHNYSPYPIVVNVLTATQCDTIETTIYTQPGSGTITPDYVG